MKDQNDKTTSQAIHIADKIREDYDKDIINILKDLNYNERRSFIYTLTSQLGLILFDFELKEIFLNDNKANT